MLNMSVCSLIKKGSSHQMAERTQKSVQRGLGPPLLAAAGARFHDNEGGVVSYYIMRDGTSHGCF